MRRQNLCSARSLPVLALAVALLSTAPPVGAQTQSIKVSDAWARRAAMAHGSMGGTMGKDMGAMGKDMAGMDKDKGTMGKDMGQHMGKMGGEGATSAVYLTVDNAGAKADALVAASTDAAKTVELHEVQKDGNVMKMRPVAKIPIPAGGKVQLKPGGYHIMLIGLAHDLKPGETIPVTLKFEQAGEVRVDATVK